jgi:hypothetical protein
MEEDAGPLFCVIVTVTGYSAFQLEAYEANLPSSLVHRWIEIVEPRDVRMFETKYAVGVILYLHGRDRPVATNHVVKAFGVRNWVAISKALRTLEEAGLITMQNARIGSKKSPAKVWRIESEVGVKVAEGFEEIDRLMSEAIRPADRRATAGTGPEEGPDTAARRGLKKAETRPRRRG